MKVYELGRKYPEEEEPFWVMSDKPIKRFQPEDKGENEYVREVDIDYNDPSIDFEIEKVPIPETITKDREEICKIISEMLDHPDKYGIYPTGKCYNELEELIQKVRVQALGYAWSVACGHLDADKDPRDLEIPIVIDVALKQLKGE